MTEETLFQEALAQPAEQRSSFLAQACAGNPKLLAAVEALLVAHEKPENVLDNPPAGLAQTSIPIQVAACHSLTRNSPKPTISVVPRMRAR